VEVVDRQEAGLPARHPTSALERLALGAVTVAAGVVGRMLVAAGRATQEVATERGGAAGDDVSGEALLLRAQDMRVRTPESIPQQA
jgi:hypothetical protein